MTIYLLAKYYKVPRDPKQTADKEYMNNPDNFAWDESVKFARKLQKRDLTDHNVVLNIFDQRVEKCNMPDMRTMNYEQLFAYYYSNYRNYFDRMFEAVGLKVEMDQVDQEGQVIEDSASQNVGTVEPTDAVAEVAAAV